MRYLFRHVLMRDAVYGMQLRARLQELHRLAAAAIERLHADDLAPYYADLAYHYGQSEMTEQERRYAILAGEKAAADYATAEAVRFLSRALELTPAGDPAGQYALLYRREQVYSLQGARELQQHDLAALRHLAQDLDRRRQIEVILREAGFANLTADWPAAIAAARSAIEQSRQEHLPDLQVTATAIWGRVLWSQGEYEAAQSHLEQALALARASRLTREEASCLLSLGNVAYCRGDFGAAMAFYSESLQACRAAGIRQGECSALNNLATVLSEQQDYAGARGYYEQVLRLSREIGGRTDEAMVLGNLARIAIDQGDYPAGLAYAEAELRIARDVRGRESEIQALIMLGVAWHRLAGYAQAAGYLDQGLQLSRDIGARRFEGWAEALLGLLSYSQGDAAGCCRHCRRALEITGETGEPNARAYALTHLGHACAAQGDYPAAAAAYRQALGMRQKLGQPYLGMENVAGLARAALAQGAKDEALQHVDAILHHLEAGSLEGTTEPIRIYWSCYEVLCAGQDGRAGPVLDQAHDLVQLYAGRISDPQIRRAYLEDVPAHRAVRAAWSRCRPEEA